VSVSDTVTTLIPSNFSTSGRPADAAIYLCLSDLVCKHYMLVFVFYTFVITVLACVH